MAADILALIGMARTAWGNVQQLREFVEDGPMVGVLQEIGKGDLQTAICALRGRHESLEPLREVEEAIGHLRRAVTGYLQSARKRRLYGLLSATAEARDTGYGNAIKALVLMAICYRYLGEGRQARAQLQAAEALWDDYVQAELDLLRDSYRIQSAGIGAQMGASDSGLISGLDDWEEMTADQDAAIAGLAGTLDQQRSELRQMIEAAATAPAPQAGALAGA